MFSPRKTSKYWLTPSVGILAAAVPKYYYVRFPGIGELAWPKPNERPSRGARIVDMPSTAKDSIPETVATAVVDKNDAQPSQPNGALGAEIPVTIHASRYSGASKSAGKLPPVHEETRTVIIFPQGAVVRLSATVTPGELVVLTNKRSGADVVCRVTSIKTQPGIQNYVNLEFAQRAVGFWEESRPSEQANPAEQLTAASTSPMRMTRPPKRSTARTRPPGALARPHRRTCPSRRRRPC